MEARVLLNLAVTEAQAKERVDGQNISIECLIVAGELRFEFLEKNLHLRLKVGEDNSHVDLQGRAELVLES